jgi:hypothetical protein
MQPRLTDLLKAVKPERALFTTFTLSLNWFESFCLPLLKMEGCEQIDLLVDSREACKLGAETTSAYAGNAFRIDSVYMNKAGIFHPKIAYFQGAEDDTLVIGSGNLTFPGQGGNLEVIDSVNAKQHPHVFEEFATFAETFIKLPGLSKTTVKTVKQYAKRARVVAAKAPASAREAPRTAWLVHTLTESAQSQLGSIVTTHLADPVELTVFSPYHAPSGNSLATLAESCGVSRTRIALRRESSGDSRDPVYVAPFDKSVKKRPKKTWSYVIAQPGHDRRYAHAKCFEVKGSAEYMVMTGSVNATSQSLCETKNVEVALVRKLETSPFDWKAAVPDEYVPCEYEREHGDTPLVSVQASLSGSTVSGTLAPNTDARQVRLEIWSRTKQEDFISNVAIAKNGDFTASIPKALDTRHALRIKVLEKGEILAVGWLNVEQELACPPHDRDLSRAAANLTTGKPSEADLRTILEQFKRILRREKTAELAVSAPLTGAAASRTSVNVTPPPTRFDEWTPQEQKKLGLSPRTAAQVLAAAFAILRRVPAQPSTRLAKKPDGHGEEDNQATKAEPRIRTTKNRRPVKLPDSPLAEMLRTLPLVLKVNATGPWTAGLVALSFAERLSSVPAPGGEDPAQDEANKVSFGHTLRQWLMDYCRFEYNEANRNRLLELFCGAAACAVYFGGEAVNPPRIKQLLDSFALRPLEAVEWLELGDKALPSPPFSALDIAVRGAVLEAALALGERLATRQELEAMVVSVAATDLESFPTDFPRYEAVHEQLKLLRRNQARSGKVSRLFGIISEEVQPLGVYTRCPVCNGQLGTVDMVALLSRDGVALHSPGCHKPVFVGLSPQRLSDAKVPDSVYGYLKADIAE